MSELRFEGRSILVTGASGGIGSATAELLLNEGATVVNLDRVAPHVDHDDQRYRWVEGDVRELSSCQNAVDVAIGATGRLNGVFCNAGVYSGGSVETQTVEDWDLQVDVILRGTFFTCKAAVPALRDTGGGSIVLSGSNCAHIGCAQRFAYTAVKGSMPVLAKQLSNDYFHSAGIRTNCVSPGIVRSGMTEEIWQRTTGGSKEQLARASENWQSASAIAEAVAFLLSDASSDVAGVTIPVSRTALLRVAAPRMA